VILLATPITGCDRDAAERQAIEQKLKDEGRL
jgi:hypothetical protein